MMEMIRSQSKDEILYVMAHVGNLAAIRQLVEDGANLEKVVDFVPEFGRSGKTEGCTSLIKACLDVGRIDVARTLIEFGADVNAYRHGRDAGAPLHHAAKAGLEQTVQLLLSNGVNATKKNDDGQTALDVARKWGMLMLSVLLRHPAAVEGSRLRSGISLSTFKQNDAQPSAVIALWKANIKEPKFYKSDPRLTINDGTTKTRYKFASANEGDERQLRWLYDACAGRPKVNNSWSSLQTATGNDTSVSTIPSAPPLIPDEAFNGGSSFSCTICF